MAAHRVIPALLVVLLISGCGGKESNEPKDSPASSTSSTPKPFEPTAPKSTPPGPQPKPPVEPAKPQPIQPQPIQPQPSSTKPEASLLATDLSRKANEEGQEEDQYLRAKYKGRFLELKGEVAGYPEIISPKSRNSTLILKVPSIQQVGCIVIVNEQVPQRRVLPGQTVTLQASIPVSDEPIVWKITDVNGDPPVRLTAEELAKSYLADRSALSSRFKDKYIVITGRIRSVVFEHKAKWPRVELEVAVPISFTLQGTSGDPTEAHSLKKGQQITAVVQFTPFSDLKQDAEALGEKSDGLHLRPGALIEAR